MFACFEDLHNFKDIFFLLVSIFQIIKFPVSILVLVTYFIYLSGYLRVGMRYAINYFKFSHFRMIRVKEELVMAPVLQSKFASKATFYLFLLPLSM